MLEPGAKAPAFTLRDQDGEKVALTSFKGQTAVLYFYPKADTPGRWSSRRPRLQVGYEPRHLPLVALEGSAQRRVGTGHEQLAARSVRSS